MVACRRRGIALRMADTCRARIVLAQAIGRWGNWFNQELFGGRPTCRGRWRSTPATATARARRTYHPTFLYESLWDLGWPAPHLARRRSRCGTAGCSRCTWPATPSGGLDRVPAVDPAHHILGLRLNNWTAVVIFIGALAYFWG